jgi:hypothetical protein
MWDAQAFNMLLVISSCIILFISALGIGIIFMLKKIPGNESSRIEMHLLSVFVECLILH